MSRIPVEISCGNLDWFLDNRPGPEERLMAAEAAWLAVPRRRRPREYSTALIGINLIWDARVLGYTPYFLAPCPACHDHPVGRCLVCSASDEDPTRWEMMPPEERKTIMAGPPLRKQVRQAKTRREKRAAGRRASE